MTKQRRSMSDMQREAWDYATGIPCEECGCTASRVFRTVRNDGLILRERICLHCGHRQKTFEHR